MDATLFFGNFLDFVRFRLDFVTHTNSWPATTGVVSIRQRSVHAE